MMWFSTISATFTNKTLYNLTGANQGYNVKRLNEFSIWIQYIVDKK